MSVFRLILETKLSVLSINCFMYVFLGGMGIFFIESLNANFSMVKLIGRELSFLHTVSSKLFHRNSRVLQRSEITSWKKFPLTEESIN